MSKKTTSTTTTPVPKKRKLDETGAAAATPGAAAPGEASMITVAVPASILAFAGTLVEQQTLVAGQLARALLVFGAHQVLVYPDPRGAEEGAEPGPDESWCVEWLCRMLEYIECPPYLRRHMFGSHEQGEMHEALAHCHTLGVARVDAMHHLRSGEWSRFREGVVGDDGRSVDVGMAKRGIMVDGGKKMEAGTRVTFEFEKDVTRDSEIYRGKVCDPMKPVVESRSRLAWGYVVKAMTSIDEIMESEEFQVRIGLDWKEGLSMKKIESKLVGPLLGKKEVKSVLIVVPPLNGKIQKGECDVRLNPVEGVQCKFVKVEELVWSGLTVLRGPLVSWIKRRRGN